MPSSCASSSTLRRCSATFVAASRGRIFLTVDVRPIRCPPSHEWHGKKVKHTHNGNKRAAVLTLNTARELKQTERIILGTDGPAGSGVQPLGILRMVAMLAAFGNVPAEIAFCFATGNTARERGLDCGLIGAGRALKRPKPAPGAK